MRSICSGRQRIEREARRHPLAVEQDLRVAAAEAAQADRAAAPGPALDRDAGQALQDVAERRVAEAIDLLAADDDLGGGRLAPLLHVVGAAAGDLHRRETLASARRPAAPVPRASAAPARAVRDEGPLLGACSGVHGARSAQNEATPRKATARTPRGRAPSGIQHAASLSTGRRRAQPAHPRRMRRHRRAAGSAADGALELGLGHLRAALDVRLGRLRVELVAGPPAFAAVRAQAAAPLRGDVVERGPARRLALAGRARSLLTVRAAISSAVFSPLPRS